MIEPKDCWIKHLCKKEECGDFCIKLFKLDTLFNEALVSTIQRQHVELRLDADGTDREEFKRLKNIENDIEAFVASGSNLYIHSLNTGNGKTAWALRLMQVYFDRIWHKCDLSCHGLFINVPRFLIALKDNFDNPSDYIAHIKAHVLDADIVIWDEIGTKVATQFEAENLLSLINARLDIGKSNIYTSNLGADELRERIGDRLYSRIMGFSTDIEFFGSDKRGI